MIVIGVAGGVASGKSTVSEMFQRLGAVVVNADNIGHQVLQDQEVIRELRKRWGEKILDDQGVNRSAVARIVFAQDSQAQNELSFLESITHPRIRQAIQAKLQAFRDRGERAVLLDAPLLLENKLDRLCNRIVFVEASQKTRLARAKLRGWSDDQFTQREQSQLDLETKRSKADWVVSTEESLEATQAQVQRIWQNLVGD